MVFTVFSVNVEPKRLLPSGNCATMSVVLGGAFEFANAGSQLSGRMHRHERRCGGLTSLCVYFHDGLRSEQRCAPSSASEGDATATSLAMGRMQTHVALAVSNTATGDCEALPRANKVAC